MAEYVATPCVNPISAKSCIRRVVQVVSRPGVMLTFKEYTRAIDMWSVGCVFVEMLIGNPCSPDATVSDLTTF